ncbi:MAG: hypothetical protein ACRCX2_28625 [Paraclostridium sp.]
MLAVSINNHIDGVALNRIYAHGNLEEALRYDILMCCCKSLYQEIYSTDLVKDIDTHVMSSDLYIHKAKMVLWKDFITGEIIGYVVDPSSKEDIHFAKIKQEDNSSFL